jgi:Arm DNA-binding domain
MSKHLISGDQAIRSVKAGDPRNRLSDGDGLYLLLFVKGGAHGWRLDYRINARRKTLSLGTYPGTGLSLARKKADDARKLVSAGTDPSDVRKSTKVEHQRQKVEDKLADAGLPPSGSFEAVAREWLATVHTAKVSGGHADRTQLRLEQDVFPWLGRRPIAGFKAPELLECLRRVEGRGAIETAHRVRQACGQVFRYGIASGQCERDLAADLRDALTPANVKHRAAITDPKRAGELLRAIEAYEGLPTTRAALQLAPLVFVRPGELRRAEWSGFDLDAGEWKHHAAITAPKRTGGLLRAIADYQGLSVTRAALRFVPLVFQRADMVLKSERGSIGWRKTTVPSRVATLIQRFSERDKALTEATARGLLRAIDAFVDMGDRRAAAIQTSEVLGE